jgi:LmbE family N-acetylglucosaminyl deacetylase
MPPAASDPQAPFASVGGIERVLVVTAHPDDVDFGAAGTIAAWTDAGIEVAYCICTSGEAGGFDESVPRPAMAELRQAEQRDAAKVLGVTDLTFLGHPDGRLLPTLELRRDISRVIRRVRPQRVITQSPERNFQRIYASHPDHLAAGDAALSAVYPDARNPFAHPELLDEGWEPWAATEVLLMAAPVPTVYVDITDTIDRKIEALRMHESQHPDPEGLDERIRLWGAATAQSAGLPDGRYAEGFLRVDTA